MRDLTPEECEFIAGGKLKKLQTMSYTPEGDPGEIVITATPPPPPPPPPYYPPPPPPPYNPPVPNGPGGGGGGGSNPGGTFDHALDTQIDAAGVAAANAIKAKADHTTQEYGAWIYKGPDGQVHVSNVLKGPNATTSPFGQPASDFGVPDGSILLGQIHNHPTYNSEGQEFSERAYADNADLNAVAQPAGYAQANHSITVDTTDFRGYIYHDSSVDEYDHVTHTTTYDPNNPGQIQPGAARTGRSRSRMIRKLFSILVIANLGGAAFAQPPPIVHSTTSKLGASQRATVQCSNRTSFEVGFDWRLHGPLVASRLSADGRPLAAKENEKVNAQLRDATDLQFVRVWCSGDHDGGVDVAFVRREKDGFASVTLTFLIRDRAVIDAMVRPRTP